MGRNMMRRIALPILQVTLAVAMIAFGALCLPVTAQPQQAPVSDNRPIRIEIDARPVESFDARDATRRRFGALEFRGGVELTSRYRAFGGISGLRIMPDGVHFIAASDRARWLRGRIVYKEGRPVGIADAEMAPMLGPDGKPLADRKWYDTESVADDGAGTIYVGIERVNKIVKFDYGKFGLLAKGQPIPVPADIDTLPNNRGLEALTVIPKGMPNAGTLIAISERGLDAAGNIKGWLIGGTSPGAFSVRRSDDYDATDCIVAPNGDLMLLERKFSWSAGVAMRVRRIALSSIVPDATVDGKILISADMGFQIDNMEGLAIHRDKNGDIVLTMISDDNFSMLQRTILLQFALVSE
jgi:hypothetical protein